MVGLGLGNAGSHSAHAHLGHELDRHVSRAIAVLQVEDELREVLNRVDVVVRRRRDEADADGRVAAASDGGVDLVAGKLAALARLGALRHLDLQLIRVGQVVDSHAEAAGRDLLDGRAPVVLKALRRLAALTGVALGTHGIHGLGQGRVRLHGDGAVRHGSGAEALDDV